MSIGTAFVVNDLMSGDGVLNLTGDNVDVIYKIPPNSNIEVTRFNIVSGLLGVGNFNTNDYPLYLCSGVDGRDISRLRSRSLQGNEIVKTSIKYIDNNGTEHIGQDMFSENELSITFKRGLV